MPSGLPSVDYIGIVVPFRFCHFFVQVEEHFILLKDIPPNTRIQFETDFVASMYDLNIPVTSYTENRVSLRGMVFHLPPTIMHFEENITVLCRHCADQTATHNPPIYPASAHSCTSKYIICLRVSTELKEILPRIPARLRFFRRSTGVGWVVDEWRRKLRGSGSRTTALSLPIY